MKTDVEALRMKTQAAALAAERIGFFLGGTCFIAAYQRYDSLLISMVAHVVAYYIATHQYDKEYNKAINMSDPEWEMKGY